MFSVFLASALLLAPKADVPAITMNAGPLIGFAKTDISPPEPLQLGGYTARGNRKSEPGGDPLYCRALAIRHRSDSIVVVSVEMLTIPESLREAVSKQIPANTYLFLSATHTHSAPDSQMLNRRMTFAIPGIARFDQRWLDWYAEKIAATIKQSLAQASHPSDYLEIQLAHVAANRGRRRLAEPITSATSVISSHEGKTIPLFFHYSAHAVFHGPERLKTSGDWPGKVEESGLGKMTLIGPIGDVSPAADGATAEEEIDDFWMKIKSAYFHQTILPSELFPFRPVRFVKTPIQLPPVQPNPEFARQNRVPEALANGFIKQFAPTEGFITGFRMGKICILGVPGEPTSALGRRIRDEGRRIGFEHVLVVSHVNGWLGYILEADDYARGGYEASLAFHGPTLAQQVYEASRKAMTELAVPIRQASPTRAIARRS